MRTAALVKPGKSVVLASMLAVASGIGAGAQDAPVALGTQATMPLASNYQNPPSGTVVLGTVTFSVGNAIDLANGQQAAFTMAYQNPSAVHLLINTGNTSLFWDGTPVGQVTLSYSNGTTQTVSLIPGTNVREWQVGAPGTDNTVTDPSNTQVWSGLATDGNAAVIDMLTVTPSSSPAPTLTGVSVSNLNTFGSLVVQLAGVTVSYTPVTTDPKPRRPGNSGNEPAATNSQSGSHANSYIFTGQIPALGQATDPVAGTNEQATKH
jgi:hypothetical protein